ncbi:hypothetical protein UFOVP403_37 [uncultured Caudovirales phage]|uniref:Uncharacterized protein n=1 Tax=uncultured Caudovirales phage TaxID=2100421 RepID=A0A6J5M190_9CAUD|nr:hypothetical protein UFOVP403_37 [uncultured Caudovirales phage]
MGPFRQGRSYKRKYPVCLPGMGVRIPLWPCHLADLLVKKSEIQYVKAIRPDAPLPPPHAGGGAGAPLGPPSRACPPGGVLRPARRGRWGAGGPAQPVAGPCRRGPLGWVMGPHRLDGGQHRAGPCWGDYCEWLPSVTPSHCQRAR